MLLLANLDGIDIRPVLPYVPAIACLYCAPSIVAWTRHHRRTGLIVGFNVLLGWTIICWILALAWSLTGVNQRDSRRVP